MAARVALGGDLEPENGRHTHYMIFDDGNAMAKECYSQVVCMRQIF